MNKNIGIYCSYLKKGNPKEWDRKELAWKLNLKPKDTFNFKSKFTRHYLYTNGLKGLGKGLTPSSYIHYFYSQGNVHQWEKIVKDMEKNPSSSFKFLSKNNSIAYYPMSIFDEEKYKKWKTVLAVSILSPAKNTVKELFRDFRKTLFSDSDLSLAGTTKILTTDCRVDFPCLLACQKKWLSK